MSTKAREIDVGDQVKFRLGPYEVIGIVVEDRGAIARSGGHIFRIRVIGDAQLHKTEDGENDHETTIEMPEDELVPQNGVTSLCDNLPA